MTDRGEEFLPNVLGVGALARIAGVVETGQCVEAVTGLNPDFPKAGSGLDR
jgi:hypothetical protein